MRLILGLALLLSTIACNPGRRVMEGRSSTSETASTAASESTEQSVDTTVLETGESYNESTTASEPVSVGGAFLTCLYKNGQAQASASYQMDCDIGPVAEVSSAITQADFFKVDAKGVRTALTITMEDLANLKWTVSETTATLAFNRVEVVLSANNATSVSLTTTITAPLVITPVLSFWLGGEPNNQILSGTEGEDCVEFGNLAAKVDHQNRTGLVSGTYGRMNDIPCGARVSSFLCRSLSSGSANPWLISTAKGVFAAAAEACPAGYSFGFPMSEKEVTEVSALIDGNNAVQNIWVNMSDRAEEGKFSIGSR
ncbi:MAG TPA: hypothetical protein VFO10_09280 [Oligoflexus sp.]|uniref:hypothetical protein n=1 Tax=Oligoflexus sp. TaxID=1971216 RepID=UPI002D7EDF48|nr:hypothetical protein [Oligoflexus sp.]HET9237431.1 hypothetical protein [Oligoflexus sp.]